MHRAANDNDFWAAFEQHVKRLCEQTDELIAECKKAERSGAELNRELQELTMLVIPASSPQQAIMEEV